MAKGGKLKEVKETAKAEHFEPFSIAIGSDGSQPTSSRGRRNVSATQERTDRFKNIDYGLIPFRYSSGVANKSNMQVRDAVILCQKCYYNFSTFRNVIDLMTDFCVGNIYFRGGNKKANSFFEALFKKINLYDFQDKFYREYFRSGNVFTYRFDGLLDDYTVDKIIQIFGSGTKKPDTKIPIRYVIINPADVQVGGNISFVVGNYYKILSDYELQRLRYPQTDEDKEVLKSLPKEVQEQVKVKSQSAVIMPLDREKVIPVFYKRQDYEPFSIPLGFPVLEDIEWKAEMKKMDMAVARTMQQWVLLITMGAEPDKGGINAQALTAMRKLFENESVGRVLVADYTTKASFVIPNIGELLNAKKYEQVNNDIQQGLNNILIGDEKFSNTSIKVQIFVERLKQARQAFLINFVNPEIRRISKGFGFKNYPEPFYEDLNLRDELEYAKVFTQLGTLGVLTPQETVKAIETGRLPDAEESVESQTQLQQHKDKGLYQPLMGGPKDQLEAAKEVQSVKNQAKKLPGKAGRPTGTKAKKKITPIKGAISLKKIGENILLANTLQSNVEKCLKDKHKLKNLNEQQNEVCNQLTSTIMANEEPEKWKELDIVKGYLENPLDKNEERVSAVQEVALEHQVDDYLAAVLHASRKED